MIEVTCDKCKQKVDVAMYYYDAHITTHDVVDVQYYRAVVNGKAICSRCGSEIKKTFHSEIPVEAIIKLAARKEDSYGSEQEYSDRSFN
jgi:hypothetical protein